MDRPPIERAMSTDVVMGIVMSHLKAGDLLNCRKVSKCWNRAASSTLRKRSTIMKNISSEAQLIELGKCMRESSDFPFAGLKFLQPWRLSNAGAIEFFRNHGPRFTSLHLGVSRKTIIQDQDLAPFMNNFPRLSILQVSDPWEPASAPHIGLLKHAAGRDDGSILNLPSLRTLRISCWETNQDFLRHVCRAASPSLQIECLNATHGNLIALQRVGKLQAVSVMTDYKEYEWDDTWLGEEMFLSTESLTLAKLEFNAHGCMSVDGLKKILILSQHNLKDLCLARINPSWFSLECPVLTKLTTLSIGTAFRSYEYVFQGCQGSKFPALKELKLDFKYRDGHYLRSSGRFSDDLFIVPSVTTIDLNGPVDTNVIKDLARNFPNVVEIRLNNRYFDVYPNEIWRSLGAFKFLEKLKIWDYPIKWPNKNYMNMDRFLTGIPNTICENLRKHPQQNLIDSPFNEILRKSPSILQLENLKELVVCVQLDNELKELPEEPPFISVVSVWYALQMMPNLEAKFVFDYSAPLWGIFKEEDSEKAVAVLKAAFKHVQPYVELEPFFY